MKTPPFFRLTPPATERPAAKSVRYPYHDDDACPVGQDVRCGGTWAPYAPTQIADTRLRCPVCIALSQAA